VVISIETVLSGDRLALARLITEVENDTEGAHQILNELFPYGGKAHIIGITGSPGTGKSSLVNKLALVMRRGEDQGLLKKIGIVAIDPSSPFSGGAFMGDRVRMRDLAGKQGIFIRSMASRGALGGLARKTSAVVQILDAAGYDIILVETVGAGQSEVEIVSLAHTTLVVETPGLGDEIQAYKAGLLEIADILVLNKADYEGVEAVRRNLAAVFEMSSEDRAKGWRPVIKNTIALTGEGIQDLAEAIADHKKHLVSSGEWLARSRDRLKVEFDILLQASLYKNWRTHVQESQYQAVMDELTARQISPQKAVDKLLNIG
jgi:LAO/AO transport system kinase